MHSKYIWILLEKSLPSLDFRLCCETWRDAFNRTGGVIGQLVAIDKAEVFFLAKSYVLLRIGRRHREAKNRDQFSINLKKDLGVLIILKLPRSDIRHQWT